MALVLPGHFCDSDSLFLELMALIPFGGGQVAVQAAPAAALGALALANNAVGPILGLWDRFQDHFHAGARREHESLRSWSNLIRSTRNYTNSSGSVATPTYMPYSSVYYGGSRLPFSRYRRFRRYRFRRHRVLRRYRRRRFVRKYRR